MSPSILKLSVAVVCSTSFLGSVRAGIIFIDADPSVPGIQDTVTLSLGETSTLDVILQADLSSIDQFKIEVELLDESVVMPGDYFAGAVVDKTVSPAVAVDANSVPISQVSVGEILTLSNDAVRILSYDNTNLVPFMSTPDDQQTVLASLAIKAISEGTTGARLTGQTWLAEGGITLDKIFTQGPTITVEDMPGVPEPDTATMWVLGVLVAGALARRNKRRSHCAHS